LFNTAADLMDTKTLILPVFLALLLILSSQLSFLLFHTLAEFFAIVVAILTTVVAWQMYAFTRNHFLMYLGCGYFWIAALDMVHTLTYKGMSIIPVTGVDTTVQFWISARYLEAFLLLTAPWFLSRSLRREIVISLYGGIATALVILIMSGYFPVSFIEGQGLTKFKIYSEYIIIAILAGAIFYLGRQRKLIDQRVFILIIMSIAFTMMAEIAFTFFVDLYGLSNLAGHILKLFSFWLIFIAVVRTTLREPFRALSKAETYYDAVPYSTVIVDDKGIIQHANKPACSLANKSIVDLIGKHTHDVFHNSDTSQKDCPICQSITNGTELSAYELHTGESSWFDFSISLIQGENNFVEVMRDISDKYHALRVLSQNVSEQREMLNSMLDAVITIDETGEIFSFNKSAEILFGYTDEEIIGKNVNQLMPDFIASQHDGYLERYVETGEAHVVGIVQEVEAQRKNKELFPMRLSVAELPKSSDGKKRFIGSCQDLTKIKQQEAQLHRSQKMEALGKLTGGIAHDYNNMLGVVTGYADLLEMELREQPKLHNYAHEIHRAGERGARLTKKLLAFSRQKISEAEMLNLNELLRDEKHLLEKTLTVRIKLAFELAENLWPVWLDSSDLEDAILNMSINAMHAIDGNGQLTLKTYNERINAMDASLLDLEPGDYVSLSITDTGSGMDDAIKEKMFDPFFSTKGEKGTGLGLSQVYGFVERSKGKIKVYSELNHGSKFVLYFPRYQHSGEDEPLAEEKNIVDIKGSETILLVDDELALLNLTSKVLAKHGYKVISAENAKKALDILDHESIDLLLSDVIMPEMDGYELSTIVQEKYPHIKIQLVSGFADDRHVNMADDYLHQHLIYKPFNSQNLLQRIRELLDGEEENKQKTDLNISLYGKDISPIKWSEQFSIGIEKIDQDHKVLVSLVNRSIVILNSGGQDNKEIQNILDELLDYTQYHFKREELLMKVCEYPGLIKHQQVHQLLIKEVRRRIKEHEIGVLTAKELQHFLADWLKNHILGMDKVIEPYCDGKENRINQEREFETSEIDHSGRFN